MLTAAQFTALYGAHAPAIRRYFGSRHLVDDADDLTQETFIRAWRARERADPDSNLLAWLYRIAHNLQADTWRLRQRQNAILATIDEDRIAELIPATEQSDPEALALRNERRRAVHAALERLTAKQRAALWQYPAQGVPLGRSRSMLKARVHYGKRRFVRVFPRSLREVA